MAADEAGGAGDEDGEAGGGVLAGRLADALFPVGAAPGFVAAGGDGGGGGGGGGGGRGEDEEEEDEGKEHGGP